MDKITAEQQQIADLREIIQYKELQLKIKAQENSEQSTRIIKLSGSLSNIRFSLNEREAAADTILKIRSEIRKAQEIMV